MRRKPCRRPPRRLPLLLLLLLLLLPPRSDGTTTVATKVPIVVECGRRPLERSKLYCKAFGWDLTSMLCVEMCALVAQKCSWHVGSLRAATEIEFSLLYEVPVVLEDGSSTTFSLDPLQDPTVSTAAFCSDKVAKDGSNVEVCTSLVTPYFRRLCEALATAVPKEVEVEVEPELGEEEDENEHAWLPNLQRMPSMGTDRQDSDKQAPFAVPWIELQQVIRPAAPGQ